MCLRKGETEESRKRNNNDTFIPVGDYQESCKFFICDLISFLLFLSCSNWNINLYME
jgi:hypothetical protein